MKIRSAPTSILDRVAGVERKAARDVIGYCRLIDSGQGSEGEPEPAFELLRRVWRQGYATDASLAVLDRARSSGHEPSVGHGLGLEHRFSPGPRSWSRGLKARGATPSLVGQGKVLWRVLADPEGIEFCVLPGIR